MRRTAAPCRERVFITAGSMERGGDAARSGAHGGVEGM
jgi:hypothetical protein